MTHRGFNALAESVIGLHKTEVVRRQGPWRDLETVEFATLEWVDWFNHRRLLGPIGHVSRRWCVNRNWHGPVPTRRFVTDRSRTTLVDQARSSD